MNIKIITKGCLAIVAVMLLAHPIPSLAAEKIPINNEIGIRSNGETTCVGGWDEKIGFFHNVNSYKSYISTLDKKQSTSPKHTGKRENNNDEPRTRSRAHGWTTWVGEYHYTRARMEEHSLGTEVILSDSGRVWGKNGTEAISPWIYFTPGVHDQARTYYGK